MSCFTHFVSPTLCKLLPLSSSVHAVYRSGITIRSAPRRNMYFHDGSYITRPENTHQFRAQPPPPGLYDWVHNAPDHVLKELVEMVEAELRARAQQRREEQERNYPPRFCQRLCGMPGCRWQCEWISYDVQSAMNHHVRQWHRCRDHWHE